MKRIAILRHAKAAHEDRDQRDFDRTLNAKGRRAAQAIGRHICEHGHTFDRILSSPAARCVETLAHVAIGCGRGLDPKFDERLYLASADELLDRAMETDEAAQTLLLVGHNPGLEELIFLLVPDDHDDELRERVVKKLPTASFAVLDCAVQRWADLSANCANLAELIRPRDLDPTLGPEFA